MRPGSAAVSVVHRTLQKKLHVLLQFYHSTMELRQVDRTSPGGVAERAFVEVQQPFEPAQVDAGSRCVVPVPPLVDGLNGHAEFPGDA